MKMDCLFMMRIATFIRKKLLRAPLPERTPFMGSAPPAWVRVPDLIRQGGSAGIDHFIVQSVATTPRQVKSINEFIAAEVEKSGGRLTGLGTLHPDSPDIAGDVAHLVSWGCAA